MLQLRNHQLDALDEAGLSRFERRMEIHLDRHFSAVVRPMSSQALASTIRHGVARARHHGIGTERQVCKYINLMFVFGRDFDLDPRLPWAAQILGGAWVHRGASPLDLLYRVALEHEASARGLDGGVS